MLSLTQGNKYRAPNSEDRLLYIRSVTSLLIDILRRKRKVKKYERRFRMEQEVKKIRGTLFKPKFFLAMVVPEQNYE